MPETKRNIVKTPTFLVLNTRLLTYQREFPQKAWLPNQLGKQESTEHYKREHTYYNAMRPIFIVLTVCGIFPAFKARSDVSRCTCYLIAIYTVLVYSAFAVLSGYTFLLIIKTSSARDTDLTHTLAISTQSLFLTQEFLYLFATWKESDYVFEYLEEWNKLQEQFKNVTGERINLLNTGRQVKFTSPLVVVWTVFGILSFYLYYDNLTLCISCVFGYQMLNTALILKLWVYNFLAISSTISQYEKHFKEKCISSQTDHQLQEFRLLWLRLTNILRQSGDMLSITVSYLTITAYVINVISAYSFIFDVVNAIQHNRNYFENVALSAVSFIITTCLMFLFYNSPYCTARKCIAAVKPHLTNMKPMKEELQDEVQLFIRTIRLVPPECNLRGFSRIDRNSLLLGFGTRVTYLIILLQFNISINEVQISSITPTPAANVTFTTV